jgi:DNA polymerase-3 subunit epsilon
MKVILDTETTGLDSKAEIIELCAIDAETGEILINQRCKPQDSIPREASRIHGIYDKDVEDSPPWEAISLSLSALLKNTEELYIYNAAYDMRMIELSNKRSGIIESTPDIKVFCVMLDFANKFNGGRWRSLKDAAQFCQINLAKYELHSAYGDCCTTLEVMGKSRLYDKPQPLKNGWLTGDGEELSDKMQKLYRKQKK